MDYNVLYCIVGILIPFVGTSLGSALVFFLKDDINKNIQKVIVGFAAGIMLAASMWSLLSPSVQMAREQGLIVWLPASVGILCGTAFLVITNKVANKITQKKNGKKLNMLLFAVTLHNIPEGMAVGVCFAGLLAQSSGINLAMATALSIGIAIQNIPEGAIISIPLKAKGKSKLSAFCYGVLSGVVEPIAAIVTVLLLNFVVPLLPYLLAFAAGAMIYVVIEELIPEMHDGERSFLGVTSVMVGFILMMILDLTM